MHNPHRSRRPQINTAEGAANFRNCGFSRLGGAADVKFAAHGGV
jgi:hypothetical protein